MAEIIDFQEIRLRHLHSDAESASFDGEFENGLRSMRDILLLSDSTESEQAAYIVLGQLLAEQGSYDSAEKCYLKAMLPCYGKYVGMGVLGLASVFFATGDYDTGYYYAKLALDMTADFFEREFYCAFLAGTTGIPAQNFREPSLDSRENLNLIDVKEERRYDNEDTLMAILRLPDAEARKALTQFKKRHPEAKDDAALLYVEMVLDAVSGNLTKAEKLAARRAKTGGDELGFVEDMLLVSEIGEDADAYLSYIKRLRAMKRPENNKDFFIYLTALIRYGLNEEAVAALSYLKDCKTHIQYSFYKAYAIALYNVGRTREAVRVLKKMHDVYGEFKDARYYIEFMLRYDASSDGPLQLYPDYTFPERMKIVFTAKIMHEIGSDDSDIYIPFNRDPLFRLALDFAFDSREDNTIILISEKIQQSGKEAFVPYIQEKLLLSGDLGTLAKHMMMKAALYCKPTAKIRFLQAGRIFEYKLYNPKSLAKYPKRYLRAYLDFASMLCTDEDFAENFALEAANTLAGYIAPENAERFKDQGALTVLFAVIARHEEMDRLLLKECCEFFGAKITTVKNYARTLNIEEFFKVYDNI